MRINELSELADQDFVQSQDIKLIKYCEEPKPEDKLHDLLMDMEPISWARAQEVIRRYAQNLALKADLGEAQPKGHVHVINSMPGGLRSSSQSLGKQRKKYDKDFRGRDITSGENLPKAEETAENQATQDFVEIVTKWLTTMQQVAPNHQK